MAKLAWDQTGTKYFESGVEQCALYVKEGGAYPKGVPWNGFTGTDESPSGAEPTKLYANNKVYLTLMSAETFGGSMTAYTYPDEFAICDGSWAVEEGFTIGQQPRSSFGLAYKSNIGEGDVQNKGYNLKLVYGCFASPSSRSRTTINDSVEAVELSWDYTCTPEAADITIGEGATAKKVTSVYTLNFNSVTMDAVKLKKLEDVLYGTDTLEPRLPLPNEVITILNAEG